jgi:predicted esterase
MEDRLELVNRLLRMGKPLDARILLEDIIKADHHNIAAWLSYAETWPVPADRKRILAVCLRLNPADPRVQEAYIALNAAESETGEPPVAEQVIHPAITSQPFNAPPAAGRPVRGNDLPTLVPPGREASLPSHPQRPASHPGVLLAGIGFFVLVVLGGVFALLSLVPLDPAKYRHDQPVEYYLYVPKAYSGDHDWPLFIGIHGAGGSGLDCWNLWQSYAEKEGFILLCPTIPGDAGGFYQDVGENTVWSAVTQVRKEYRLSSPMFLSGFSAGAFFVQGFTYHYPQAVSGIAVLSAGNYLGLGLSLRNIPVLVVIGDRDDPSSVQGSQDFVNFLTKSGFDVQYEVLPGVDHRVTRRGRQLTIALFRKTMGQ